MTRLTELVVASLALGTKLEGAGRVFHPSCPQEGGAVAAAVTYLETGRDTYATAADGDAFYAAMVAAYPDYDGEFLLQLATYEYLYPSEE